LVKRKKNRSQHGFNTEGTRAPLQEQQEEKVVVVMVVVVVVAAV
jgi:hypothetical protein